MNDLIRRAVIEIRTDGQVSNRTRTQLTAYGVDVDALEERHGKRN